jgi:hypothetical protein
MVASPEGRQFKVQVPTGVSAGMVFQVQVPAPVLHTTAVEVGAPADAGGVRRLSAEHVTLVGGGAQAGGGVHVIAPGSVTVMDGTPAMTYTTKNPYATVVVPSGAGGAPPPAREPIPDIEADRHLWFSYWDKDSGGTLDMDELAAALVATFKLEGAKAAQMRETVQAVWVAFDMNMDGSISLSEFCTSNGLGDTIIASLRRRSST